MDARTVRRLTAVVVLCLGGVACAAAQPVPNRAASESGLGDFSGMVMVAPDEYLVVSDRKVDEDVHLSGFAQVGTAPGDKAYRENLRVRWIEGEPATNDLEAVCALPGRQNEYLAAESSWRKGRFGRLLHLRLVETKAGTEGRLIGAVRMPKSIVNIEGLVCLAGPEGTTWIVLGERGGSVEMPQGTIKWGRLDAQLEGWIEQPEAPRSFEAVAPAWGKQTDNRDISDLHLDAQGVIWASAAEDPGDDGPFRSLIYAVAQVAAPGMEAPIVKIDNPRARWRLDGIKVEALAACAREGCALAIGTDDENLGGIWRPTGMALPGGVLALPGGVLALPGGVLPRSLNAR